jgi:hypothetical protein
MECRFEIKVMEPQNDDMLFGPYVKFRLEQLNLTPNCRTDAEIDYQVDAIIREAEKLRKKAKKNLKDAQKRHDELLERRRVESSTSVNK